MNKKIWLIAVLAIILLIALITIYFKFIKGDNPFSQKAIDSPSSSQATPSVTPTSVFDPKYGLTYPMSNFKSRVWLNGFGNNPSKTINRNDYSDYICTGQTMKDGLHTAVDAEVSREEINEDIPVYSIADGEVRQAQEVSGYGGLIIIQYNIQGADYTALYGHLNSKTFSAKEGSKVTKGEKLALLGAECSSENGNVRKHLHFGIHKGTAIDIKGYVANTIALSSWLDPFQLYS